MFFKLIARSIAICFLLAAETWQAGQSFGQAKAKTPNAALPSSSLSLSLDDFFERAEAFGFSGSVIVAKGDQIILRKAYGYSDRGHSIANTPTTVFGLASLDKQFIAAAILRLEEMGKLSTTDSITKFFDFVPQDKSAITLHQLLSHTSGLKAEYWDEHPELSREQFVRLVLHDQPLRSLPGTKQHYTNSAFIVLEEVISRVSGKPYEVFLEEALFKPAGMKETGLSSGNWNTANVAQYQLWTLDIEKFGGLPDPLKRPLPRWMIMSTVDDMYRWYQALKSNRVLTPASKKKLFTVVMDEYSYGWNVVQTPRGTKLIHHGGGGTSDGMLSTFHWFIAEDVVVCILSNTMNPYLSADYFMADVESLIFGGTSSLPPERESDIPVDAKQMLGTYGFPNGASFQLRQARDGRLAIVTQDAGAIMLLRFPDADAPIDSVPQDKIATDVINAAAAGDYEPLRKILGKVQPFESVKMYFESTKKQLGELRKVSTLYQQWFYYNGAPEVQSYIRLEYEKRVVIQRVRHFPSGQMTFQLVNPPEGVEIILLPTIGGNHSTWDFTLGNGAQITLDAESALPRLTLRGPHGSIIAVKRREE